MEVMPAGTRFLRAVSRAFGDPQGTRWVQSKNPAERPGRGPETLSHSGRGDAAEGPAITIRSRAPSSVRARFPLVPARGAPRRSRRGPPVAGPSHNGFPLARE